MSSSESWKTFFVDAGIPSVSAKNYGTIFDDNRITKDMLLDLDKETLKDMGISIMGDMIAILKHAKKVYSKELKKKESSVMSGGKSQLVKVAPLSNTTAITIPARTKHQPQQVEDSPPSPDNMVLKKPKSTVIALPQAPPKQDTPTWSSPTSSSHQLGSISTDVQYTTATYKNQQKQQQHKSSDIPQYGTALHSDKLIAAATTAQQQRPSTQMVMEEYTTSTYEERMKKKRAISQVVSQTTPPSRVTVLIPSSPSPPGKRVNHDKTVDRSKRFLEAAGIIESTDSSDSFSRVTPKQQSQSSVFSRLELSGSKSNPEITTKRSPINIKARLGKRIASQSEVDVSKSTKSPSLYSEKMDDSNIRDRLGSNKESKEATLTSVKESGSMVADGISRHSDVHARLKKKGVSLSSSTHSGPLGKRLGRHAVFGRLE